MAAVSTLNALMANAAGLLPDLVAMVACMHHLVQVRSEDGAQSKTWDRRTRLSQSYSPFEATAS